MDGDILRHHGNGSSMVSVEIIRLICRDPSLGVVPYRVASFSGTSFLDFCKDLLE